MPSFRLAALQYDYLQYLRDVMVSNWLKDRIIHKLRKIICDLYHQKRYTLWQSNIHVAETFPRWLGRYTPHMQLSNQISRIKLVERNKTMLDYILERELLTVVYRTTKL